MTAHKYAEVVVLITHKDVDHSFHYAIPEGLRDAITLGMRVVVPFGKGAKSCEGFIVGFTDEVSIPPEKMKKILYLPDSYPIFNEERLALARWMKVKYYATMAACLQCIMPVGLKQKAGKDLSQRKRYASLNIGNEALQEVLAAAGPEPAPRARVLKLLADKGSLALNDITVALGISMSPLRTLERAGLIRLEDIEIRRDAIQDILKGSDLDDSQLPHRLTDEQEQAVHFLLQSYHAAERKPVLLHGVTGSGKTEIYMRVIEQVLRDGKQAIVLVPEISLTPQTVRVFVERFGKRITVTHSRLTINERFDQWKKAQEGQVSIIIGPRSAVFAPFDKLGVIIIDEEHEHTYKSETTPKYATKEAAIERGRLSGALVILGSATPSVESYYEAMNGQFHLLRLTERINKMLPEIIVTDMRQEPGAGNNAIFSQGLLAAMRETIGAGRQVILFLNRRGFSTFVSCRKCGHVLACDSCNVNFTYHRHGESLLCHYCGKKIKTPEECPVCGSRYIKYFGLGTQRIEEEVKKTFPHCTTLRMDMDTTRGKAGHEKILRVFRESGAAVLIGTQMIAKGLDFPNVTLVGVVAADLSLNAGDFRAAETTYQLLTQVAGRAGRGRNSGRVFIQTYNPGHYSIAYAKEGNYEEFYGHEIILRRQLAYPPFTHVFLVMATGYDEKKIIVTLHKLLDIMKYCDKKASEKRRAIEVASDKPFSAEAGNSYDMLGPVPAVVSKVKNQYRWKLIVKSVDEDKLRRFVLYCIDKLNTLTDMDGVTMHLTLDPVLID